MDPGWPYKRDVNTVFQSYALSPHLDIFENIAFRTTPRSTRRSRRRWGPVFVFGLALALVNVYVGRRTARAEASAMQMAASAAAAGA